uniref:Uncharacterized protein n=1 Tax=Physcomitrium patens TaxID=3218 RepID=A0A7I4C7S3_PHYPA
MTWFTSGTGIRVLRLDPLDRKERLGLGKELLTEIEDLGIVEKQVGLTRPSQKQDSCLSASVDLLTFLSTFDLLISIPSI